MFQLRIRMDDMLTLNRITYFGAVDWLSTIGGLTTTMMGVAGAICRVLARPFFMYDILKTLFLVKSEQITDIDIDRIKKQKEMQLKMKE